VVWRYYLLCCFFPSPSLFYLLVHSRCRGFLWFHLITLRHTTVGRTPLDEGSARRREPYLTTQTLYKRQTSMPPVGLEPTIPASARPQTYALDCAATGIGRKVYFSTAFQDVVVVHKICPHVVVYVIECVDIARYDVLTVVFLKIQVSCEITMCRRMSGSRTSKEHINYIIMSWISWHLKIEALPSFETSGITHPRHSIFQRNLTLCSRCLLARRPRCTRSVAVRHLSYRSADALQCHWGCDATVSLKNCDRYATK
jgi:hypothetical protein